MRATAATRRPAAQTHTGPHAPRTDAQPGLDRPFLLGLAGILLVAATLRGVALTAHLPQLPAPDEPTTVGRALSALHGQLVPDAFDWPPASAYLLALVQRAAAVLGLTGTDEGSVYLVGRALFAGISVAVVVLTGLLGWELAEGSRGHRRLVGWGAAGAVAVSYLMVRTGRIIHPDQLQAACMLGCVLATARHERAFGPPVQGQPGVAAATGLAALAGAGLLAGLAGATKYLGLLVAVVPLAAALRVRAGGRGRGARTSVVIAGILAGVTAATGGLALLRPGQVWGGVWWQLSHQATGHLGYELQGPAWWFHLTRSLPGNWGVGLTLLAAVGTATALGPRTRPLLRVVSLLTVCLFVLVGASRVEFPHYVLPAVPLLAVLAFVAVSRGWHRWGRAGLAIALAVALLPALLTVGDDLRLLTTARSPDTRELAMAMVARLPHPIWAEAYTVSTGADQIRPALGQDPSVLGCRCRVLISSYMEERFRQHPERHPGEVAVYDELRRRGHVVAVIAPPVPLAYNWDLLPSAGLRSLPLLRAGTPAGPTITVLELD